MRVVLAPINPRVGDIQGAAALMRDAIAHAASTAADLLVFPELAITSYPPRDLLLHDGFIEAARDAVLDLATALPPGVTALVGTPWRPPLDSDPDREPDAFDSRAPATNSLVALRHDGPIARYDKRLLPDYDVFDEPRYFRPGDRAVVIDVAGVNVGLAICEDLWKGDDTPFAFRYAGTPDPLDELARAGADLVAVASASPFIRGKSKLQARLLADRCAQSGMTLAAVNLLGANDDLIFDGHTAVCVPDGAGGGKLVAVDPPFDQSPLTIDLPSDPRDRATLPAVEDPFLAADEDRLVFDALTLGVRDYARKSGFTGATLGVSGGIDSALCATLAAAALGPRNVLGVKLPSRHSSDHSVTDADELAARLGMPIDEYPIEPAHDVFERTLGQLFQRLGLPREDGLTEENVQSRIRGLTMMAVSNKSGRLLLSTGNKSEHAVGYATLYGDMNGGLAPIADLLKTEVVALARYINQHHRALGFPRPPIPENTIAKPPSAELKPGQTDQDTLPAYDDLDRIISLYVDDRRTPDDIAQRTGLNETLVRDIVRKIDLAEFKRFQLCVALKVRPRAFGPGRRRPVVAKHGGG